MVCVLAFIFFACATCLQACPEPVAVHIQNYERPIILHTANCDDQPRNHGNYNQYHQCETECTCVSKINCSPYVYNGYPTTSGSYTVTNVGANVGCNGFYSVANVGSNGGCTGSNVGCCPANDVHVQPLVYTCILSGYGNNDNSYNQCGKGSNQNKYCGCY